LDTWGLIAFSVAAVLLDQANGWSDFLTGTAWDLGGAIALGCALGAPATYLTGRLKPGEPLQAEAIGIVLLAAGLALWLEVSFLVTGMTTGAIIANFAKHHDRAFHEIEHIQWPFMILFFLLAGAVLEVDALLLLGSTGVAFLLLRIVARITGGFIGAKLGSLPQREVPWYGPALLPQAGVAVGMALVAGERFPEWASAIMAFTIASTIIFEIIGPPMTLVAIQKASN
jgi:Kef-type K+ transport system membrane component KefB